MSESLHLCDALLYLSCLPEGHQLVSGWSEMLPCPFEQAGVMVSSGGVFLLLGHTFEQLSLVHNMSLGHVTQRVAMSF